MQISSLRSKRSMLYFVFLPLMVHQCAVYSLYKVVVQILRLRVINKKVKCWNLNTAKMPQLGPWARPLILSVPQEAISWLTLHSDLRFLASWYMSNWISLCCKVCMTNKGQCRITNQPLVEAFGLVEETEAPREGSTQKGPITSPGLNTGLFHCEVTAHSYAAS